MRRTITAALTAGVAGVLALALAALAAAEGEIDWSEQSKARLNGQSAYKYGFDYYKAEHRSTPGAVNYFDQKTPQPVKAPVNPSATGPSYYLNQARNRVVAPSNVPLTGKIIEPGKSVVRIPSTYGPVTKFASVAGKVLPLGFSRLMGGAGVGIGGMTQPPANYRDLALAQGVTQGCLDGGSCTSDEIAKTFKISSCGHFQSGSPNSCSAIGAVDADGISDVSKWFRDEALPFLDDLWAQITGQEPAAMVADSHQEIVKTWGCQISYGVEYRGSNNFTLHFTGIRADGPRPTTSPQSGYYDSDCSAAAQVDYGAVAGLQITSVCIDGNGFTANASNASYGYTKASINDIDRVTGVNKTGYCSPGTQLMKLQIWNESTQASFTGPASNKYNSVSFFEWVNPDTTLNTIEDTKITTSWDCRTVDGVVYTFSKSVEKVSAAVSPTCPAGSDLIRHDIKASQRNGGTPVTLDAGQEKPAEVAKYPGCFSGPGCTLDVYIDGIKCNTANVECRDWPQTNTSTPSRVQCKWGSYVVETGNCNQISNGYKSDVGVVFDPNSGSWVGVDTNGNPLPANPEPWNPTNPNPVPGTNPQTPTTPGAGTTSPTFPTTGTNPATGDNCSAPTWSWNPVEFVKNPVVCALLDAFVPKTDFAARNAALSNIVMDKPPMNWLTPVFTGPGGGGCPNWVVSVPGFSQNVVCESSFTAAIVGARYPLFGLVSAAMVWPLIRSIWYAAIPVLRVSPGSHK